MAVEIHDGRCLFRGDGDEPCARHRSGYPARLAESRPSDWLAAALRGWYAPDPWERDDHEFSDPGDYHCYACGASVHIERDPTSPNWWEITPAPEEGHADGCLWLAYRATLVEADSPASAEPAMSVAMSDPDEGQA
jgi:hypothetical protein